MTNLLLKRATVASGEVYDVHADDKIVARIMLSNVEPAAPWVWMLAYGEHEDRTPTHGYEPNREAAMQAFARSWNSE